MEDELRILCVCTHNRTRSVLIAALLDRYLSELGVRARVRSVGTKAAGKPPMAETIGLLAVRGIDVSAHRSHLINDPSVSDADLIVTAEHHHVLDIAGRTPEMFSKTYTLPEFVARAEQIGARGGRRFDTWLGDVAADRGGPLEFLDAIDSGKIPEIRDPTGHPTKVWTGVLSQIEDLTQRLAQLLR